MDKSGNGSATVRVTGVEVPIGVVSFRSRVPSAAEGDTVKVVVNDVEFPTIVSLTVIPPILSNVVASGTKFRPVNATFTDVPRTTSAGSMPVTTGTGVNTLNVIGDDVPPNVVSVTSRGPGSAFAATLNTAVADVVLLVLRPESVTPDPLMFRDGEKKLVPVRATA